MKLLIILFAMLAMSAGAVHSWQSKGLHVRAAQLSEAYAVVGPVKKRVSDHFIEYGVMPNSNIEADLPIAGRLSGINVQRVSVLQGGVIELGFNGSGAIDSGSMIFAPSVSPVTGYLFWQCSSDTIDRAVLRKLRPACSSVPETLGSQLKRAIADRNLRAFDNLLNQGVNPSGFLQGMTPLMRVASIGDLELLDRLLDQSVDIDSKATNHDGLTALMMATRSLHIPLVNKLLASGASTSVKDNHGRTARYHAAQISHRYGVDQLSIILEQAENPQFKAHPADSASRAIVRFTNWNHEELIKNKMSMLGNYCLQTSFESLKFQLKESCDMAISELPKPSAEQPRIGSVTLSVAMDELTEPLLLEYVDEFVVNSDQINTRDLTGQLSLFKAISVNMPAFATVLIDRGADVNALSTHSSRPLIEASKLGDAHLVRHLVNEGADLNATDALGRTALLAAVGRGHSSVVDALIQAGAQTHMIDSNGVDALLLAKSRRDSTIEHLLLVARGG